MTQPRFDSDTAHDKGTATFAPASDTPTNQSRRPNALSAAGSLMGASPPGAHIRAEAEARTALRKALRSMMRGGL